MTRYSKCIIAFLTALGTWGYTALAADSDGVVSVTAQEWFGLCGVLVAAFSVFAVPNRPPEGEPADPAMSEQGHADMPTLVVMAAIALVVVFAVLFAFDVLPT